MHYVSTQKERELQTWEQCLKESFFKEQEVNADSKDTSVTLMQYLRSNSVSPAKWMKQNKKKDKKQQQRQSCNKN
jgi:hypothetical protein